MMTLDIVCNSVTIPEGVATIVSMIIKFFYIGIPILLIILGMFDFGKAVMCQKEEDIKKHQKMFVKRLASAIIVFFVAMIVEFGLNVMAKANVPGTAGVAKCINEIIEY